MTSSVRRLAENILETGRGNQSFAGQPGHRMRWDAWGKTSDRRYRQSSLNRNKNLNDECGGKHEGSETTKATALSGPCFGWWSWRQLTCAGEFCVLSQPYVTWTLASLFMCVHKVMVKLKALLIFPLSRYKGNTRRIWKFDCLVVNEL